MEDMKQTFGKAE